MNDIQLMVDNYLKSLLKRTSSFTLTDGGKVDAESFQQFMLTSGGEGTPLIDQVVKNGCFLIRGTDTINIPSMGLARRQLQKATAGTAPGSVVAFTNNKATITTEEVIYPVDIDYRDLEDAIGKAPGEAGKAASNAYMDKAIGDLVMKAIGNDLQDLTLNGDTQSGTPFLQTFDGLLKLVKASGTHYNPGAAQTILEFLNGLYRVLPANARGNKRLLNFLLAAEEYDELEDTYANRGTTLGDKVLTTDNEGQLFFKGIKVKEVAEEAQYTAVLAHDKAIFIGANREMTIEKMRQPRKRMVELTVSMRVGHAEALDFIAVGTRTP